MKPKKAVVEVIRAQARAARRGDLMFDDQRQGEDGGLEMVHVGTNGEPSWREIDRRLKRVATARAGLDAEELLWLARAERAEIHRRFGHATILEYVERVLGYGPRVARERLRVARALAFLPKLRAELEAARISYSAVREVSRVAKPETEAAWIARVAGCSLREIEQATAGHKPGDNPDDPPDPDLALRPITLELTPRTLALFREASRLLEDEVGHPLDDDELMATLCASALRRPSTTVAAAEDPDADADGDARAHVDHAAPDPSTSAPPPPYQLAFTVCLHCRRTTHDAAGRSYDVPQSALEQALCNAQNLGRIDADVPARATRTIPPAVERLVWRRDGGHCVVPGCRSTRFIEVHHIQYRSRGGDHSPGNLACLCFAHHAALHEARLRITGTAPDALIFERVDPLLGAMLPVWTPNQPTNQPTSPPCRPSPSK